MEVGDFVKGKPESDKVYSITTSQMTRGLVTEVNGDMIKVKILDHENDGKGIHLVKSNLFEVIGHVKPFSREEVLELLKKGCKKELLNFDLRRANLSGADLNGADLDFSCLPLRCGGLKWKIDKRIACQLAYHFCSMQCEDPEFIKMRNILLPFANQFHRVNECGALEIIQEQVKEKEDDA
jgi:hypothetical protein